MDWTQKQWQRSHDLDRPGRVHARRLRPWPSPLDHELDVQVRGERPGKPPLRTVEVALTLRSDQALPAMLVLPASIDHVPPAQLHVRRVAHEERAGVAHWRLSAEEGTYRVFQAANGSLTLDPWTFRTTGSSSGTALVGAELRCGDQLLQDLTGADFDPPRTCTLSAPRSLPLDLR